jgi:transposase
MDVCRHQANTKRKGREIMNNLGIDVGKKKCRAALKDERGEIVSEFFFSNNTEGISTLIKTASSYGKCTAVLESTANMWIRIHDTLEENGIDTILANPYKTKIIAEAKIKSDKLDAKILADLLRTGLIYESYVPTKEFREKRSLIRHRISLVRNRTMLENKVHSLLDKYDYKTDLTNVFGKSGMKWLKTLDVSRIDKVILNTTLAAIENINLQIDIISKELAGYAHDSEDVRYFSV